LVQNSRLRFDVIEKGSFIHSLFESNN
jgi:hypothetical protein